MKKSASSYVTIALRILMGLMFAVFGFNKIVNFLPVPPMSGPIVTYFTGLMAARYFMPFLGGTEVICGLLLMTNMFVPLALTILAPIILNIIGTHLFLEPSGLVMALPILAIEIYLAWVYRKFFGPMLVKTAKI